MKKGAIIFDLFDTLMHVDKRNDAYAEVKRSLEKRMRKDGLEQQEVKDALMQFRKLFITTPTSTDIVADLLACSYFQERPYFEALLQDLFNIPWQNELKEMVEEQVCSVATIEGAVRVVADLSKSYHLALVSNLASPFKSPFLESELAEFFPTQVFSCDEGHLKPERIMFEKALLGFPNMDRNSIIVIGDKLRNDGEGAVACGLHYFRVNEASRIGDVTKFLF